MADLYDFSLVSAQDGFIEQILVFNYWSSGLLFTGLLVAFAFIVFTVARYSDRPVNECIIYTGYFGTLTSILFWLFRYNNEPSVPTLIPIMFIFLICAGVVIKIMKGTINQTD